MSDSFPPDNPQSPPPKYRSLEEASRIYLLPNLFTAGNMLCGFLSVRACILAKYAAADAAAAGALYQQAVYFILGACICDLFDGRVARMSKRESLFGAEFDSIADTVSFGVAPALMVFFLILNPNPAGDVGFFGSIGREFGWFFAFIYLLCVGIRLARFNVLTNPLIPGSGTKKYSSDFIGLPSPTAAGMIASLVLLITHLSKISPEGDSAFQKIIPLLLLLTLLISYLMVSNIRYPSFKQINLSTRSKIRVFILIFILLIVTLKFFHYAIPVLFLAFIVNGIIYTARQKYISKKTPEPEPAAGDNPEDVF